MNVRDVLCILLMFLVLEGVSRLWMGSSQVDDDAVLSMTVHHALENRSLDSKEVLLLAGISRRKTYLCNETNGPQYFNSDRYGFNNEDDVWNVSVDTVLIGDSFVQGYCVPRDQTLAALIQKSGDKVLNLGLKGTGPLSQLGVLKEYALEQKPRRVVWFILANDILYDFSREIRRAELVSYLKNKRQFLKSRQTEIDKQAVQLGATERLGSRPLPRFPDALLRLITATFRIDPLRPLSEEISEMEIPDKRVDAYVAILKNGADAAHSAGAKVEFVFIPDSWVFSKREGPKVRQMISKLKLALSKKNLHLIDPTSSFDQTNRPLEYFAALEGSYGHYNAQGFRLLSKHVPALRPPIQRGTAVTVVK